MVPRELACLVDLDHPYSRLRYDSQVVRLHQRGCLQNRLLARLRSSMLLLVLLVALLVVLQVSLLFVLLVILLCFHLLLEQNQDVGVDFRRPILKVES